MFKKSNCSEESKKKMFVPPISTRILKVSTFHSRTFNSL